MHGPPPPNGLPENAAQPGEGQVAKCDFTLKTKHLLQRAWPSGHHRPANSAAAPNHDRNPIKHACRIKAGTESRELYSHSSKTENSGCAGPERVKTRSPGDRRASGSRSGLAPNGRTHRYLHCAFLGGPASQRRRQAKRQSVSCARGQCAEFWTRIQVTAQSLLLFITNIVDFLDLMEWREKSTCKQLSFCYFHPLLVQSRPAGSCR